MKAVERGWDADWIALAYEMSRKKLISCNFFHLDNAL